MDRISYQRAPCGHYNSQYLITNNLPGLIEVIGKDQWKHSGLSALIMKTFVLSGSLPSNLWQGTFKDEAILVKETYNANVVEAW